MILLTYFGYFGHKLTLDGIFGGIFAGMWDGDGIPELAGGMRMGFGRKWTVAGWDWDLILEKSDTSTYGRPDCRVQATLQEMTRSSVARSPASI